jgi:hypothetical protein
MRRATSCVSTRQNTAFSCAKGGPLQLVPQAQGVMLTFRINVHNLYTARVSRPLLPLTTTALYIFYVIYEMSNPRSQNLSRNNARPATDIRGNAHDPFPQTEPVDETNPVTRLAASTGTESIVMSDELEGINLDEINLHHKVDPNLPSKAGYNYAGLSAKAYATQHNGDVFRGPVYNVVNNFDPAYRDIWRVEDTTLGFNFNLGPSSVDKQQKSATHAARRNRSKFTLKKRPAVGSLMWT